MLTHVLHTSGSGHRPTDMNIRVQ